MQVTMIQAVEDWEQRVPVAKDGRVIGSSQIPLLHCMGTEARILDTTVHLLRVEDGSGYQRVMKETGRK